MDSQSIGSVTSATSTATSLAQQSRSQGSSQATAEATAKAAQAAATARQQHREQEQAAQAAREAEIKVPQRDPRSLQYQVDGATHRVVATIIDDGSKTVVRQIPDAEILRIAQAIDRMQGFLVEEKA